MAQGYKKPDLNAPRFRTDRYSVLGVELFRKFKKRFPEHKITTKEFTKIVMAYSSKLREVVVNTRDGVELPKSIGTIFIGSCPAPKKKNYNPIVSAIYDKPLQHRNFESDNMIAKIFYSNFANRYKLKDRELWMFKSDRAFSRSVAKAYPENWKMYLQVDSFQLISRIYRKHINRDIAIRLSKPISEDYNEFDMN